MTLPRPAWLVLISVVTVLMTACSSGTDFKRPDAASFELGKTTEREIRAPYGEPRSRGTIQADDKTIKTLSYAYAEAAPYVEKVPVRVMVYSFHEDRLVGFDYSSSFSSDKTDFDDSVLGKVVRGQTTRTQVVELLGKPTGMFIYPSSIVTVSDHRAYLYSYSRTDKSPLGGQLKTTTKTLVVTFDRRDVVIETKLSTGGNK